MCRRMGAALRPRILRLPSSGADHHRSSASLADILYDDETIEGTYVELADFPHGRADAFQCTTSATLQP